jgi:hypothetical protein
MSLALVSAKVQLDRPKGVPSIREVIVVLNSNLHCVAQECGYIIFSHSVREVAVLRDGGPNM